MANLYWAIDLGGVSRWTAIGQSDSIAAEQIGSSPFKGLLAGQMSAPPFSTKIRKNKRTKAKFCNQASKYPRVSSAFKFLQS